MTIKLITTFFIAISLDASNQGVTDRDLAYMLSKPGSRQLAISEIEASKDSRISLLLSWTQHPPAWLNELEVDQLYVGVADVFRYFKTKEAIPFLIKNISLDRARITNVWSRSPSIIISRLPSVAALIEIGRDASEAIMRTPMSNMSANDRLAAVFVVSRVPGVADAREYLTSALGDANMLRERTQEGLEFLDAHH